MYLHIFILTVAVLEFSMLPFSATSSLAEHIDSKELKSSGKFCSISLPDPEKTLCRRKGMVHNLSGGNLLCARVERHYL